MHRKADLELVVGVGDQGVDGVGGNAAVVVLVAGHLDVAGITPSSRPGVLYQKVLKIKLKMF